MTVIPAAQKTTADKTKTGDDDAYVLEPVELEESDDEFDYEEVPFEYDDNDDTDENEDFETALKSLKNKSVVDTSRPAIAVKSGVEASVSKRPAVIDDFIRNFFIKAGLSKSLETFQTEWYERGSDDMIGVPDVYAQNQQLEDLVKNLRSELERAQDIATKARSTWDKLRKERDFHRMHHKRVVQEKNKLLQDLKRLRRHYANYEPTLNELRHKYETAMKEKMLMRLERDRMAAKVEGLEATIKQLEAMKPAAEPVPEKKTKRRGKDSTLPLEERVNPYLNLNFEPMPVERLQLAKTFKGHTMAISSMALHPKKAIVATASDDSTWKMWALPTGDLIMSGDGHKDWVSSCDFHPKGTHLATASGDGTVKVWDFAHSVCSATFTDHTQAVWACAFHDLGDFLVSCSMDHTSKVWDLNSQRCRQTLRGHVDSVNWVVFQPFSNNICTGSGDKTVSVWDVRTGLCVQTFYGHMNACNHVSINIKGDTIASTDADGVVKVWDVRMVAERLQFQVGPHSANKSSFDRSSTLLGVASDDSFARIFNLTNGRMAHELKSHEDAVQGVLLDPYGKYVLTCSSDCSFKLWTTAPLQ